MESSRLRTWGAATQDGSRYRRRQGYNERFAEYENRKQRQTVSFFIYNFPEDWDAKALWYRFQNCGKVVDVYLPGKRDRRGKRFGFLRMEGVQEVERMEDRLNRIWIGSYKLRAKQATDRGQRGEGNLGKPGKRVMKPPARTKVGIREHRYVQPGLSFVNAVMGEHSRTANVQGRKKQSEKKEGAETVAGSSRSQGEPGNSALEGLSYKDGVKISRINKEELFEFSPQKEENKWLEGSMIIVVRTMSVISDIQERVDVDGGLIKIAPMGGRSLLLTEQLEGYLGEYLRQHKELFEIWCEAVHPWEMAPQKCGRMVWLRISGVPLKAWTDRCFEGIAASVGEVIMVHEDTKMKSILCDGRVLILCTEMHKISKSMKLKVEEKLYEVEVTEEEWRADPDWWLTEEDRRNESETSSGYSSSENGEDEDHEVTASAIRADEEEMIDVERLMEEGDLNSKAGEGKEGRRAEGEKEKLPIGLHSEKGQRMGSKVRLDDDFGPNENVSYVMDTIEIMNGPKGRGGKSEEMKETAEEEPNTGSYLGLRDLREKKEKRELRDCYLQEMVTSEGGGKQRSNGRTMQQDRKNHEGQKYAAKGTKLLEQRAGSESLSDGCINHRNKVIQREMNLKEVRRIFKVGQRLGIRVEENDEEVQSKLLEMEERDEGQGRE
ncbi:hypothetical protein SLA2020_080620 [Shorea laevis]